MSNNVYYIRARYAPAPGLLFFRFSKTPDTLSTTPGAQGCQLPDSKHSTENEIYYNPSILYSTPGQCVPGTMGGQCATWGKDTQ
jgi:hypothetical protein